MFAALHDIPRTLFEENNEFAAFNSQVARRAEQPPSDERFGAPAAKRARKAPSRFAPTLSASFEDDDGPASANEDAMRAAVPAAASRLPDRSASIECFADPGASKRPAGAAKKTTTKKAETPSSATKITYMSPQDMHRERIIKICGRDAYENDQLNIEHSSCEELELDDIERRMHMERRRRRRRQQQRKQSRASQLDELSAAASTLTMFSASRDRSASCAHPKRKRARPADDFTGLDSRASELSSGRDSALAFKVTKPSTTLHGLEFDADDEFGSVVGGFDSGAHTPLMRDDVSGSDDDDDSVSLFERRERLRSQVGFAAAASQAAECFWCSWCKGATVTISNRCVSELRDIMFNRPNQDPRIVAREAHRYYMQRIWSDAQCRSQGLPVWRTRNIYLCITEHNFSPLLYQFQALRELWQLSQATFERAGTRHQRLIGVGEDNAGKQMSLIPREEKDQATLLEEDHIKAQNASLSKSFKESFFRLLKEDLSNTVFTTPDEATQQRTAMYNPRSVRQAPRPNLQDARF